MRIFLRFSFKGNKPFSGWASLQDIDKRFLLQLHGLQHESGIAPDVAMSRGSYMVPCPKETVIANEK